MKARRMAQVKSKRTIQREIAKLDAELNLQPWPFNKRGADMRFGARQALRWVIRKSSPCVSR